MTMPIEPYPFYDYPRRPTLVEVLTWGVMDDGAPGTESVFPSYREAREFVDALANGGAA